MTQQKIALVTGGNRGIGFEIVRQLAQQDITVILTARQLAEAEDAVKTLETHGLQALPLQLDITKADDIKAAVEFVTMQFGGLDILINNGGIYLDEKESTSSDMLRQTFEVNAIGPYMLSQALLPLLKKSDAGRIVYQSSIMGSLTHAAEGGGSPAYRSSKAALNMLSIVQARELKDTKIKVNAVHPGWVKTRMGGDAAPLAPHEGAKSAIRLALLPEDGPTGGFFHLDKELAW